MPQQRMDIRMIKDILRLKYQGGLSHSAIARSLAISKGVVAKYLGLAGATSVSLTIKWPSGLEQTFTNVAANRVYTVTEGQAPK